MLRGWRIGFPCPRIRDRSAIANSPHARPARYFHILIGGDLPSILSAGDGIQNRVRCRPRGPDKGLGGQSRSVTEFNNSIAICQYTGIQTDFDAALLQLLLGIDAKFFAQLRKNHWPGMNQNDSQVALDKVLVE